MPTIIENRRNLHQIPEIELTTQKTAQYIENVLDLYDCTIDHPIPNSVTAFFDNKKEKQLFFVPIWTLFLWKKIQIWNLKAPMDVCTPADMMDIWRWF